MFYTLYSKVLDCFLNQEFDNYSIDQGDSISKDVFTSLMKSISGQVSGKEINNYMDKKKLNLEEFKAIYRALLNLQKYQRWSSVTLLNFAFGRNGKTSFLKSEKKCLHTSQKWRKRKGGNKALHYGLYPMENRTAPRRPLKIDFCQINFNYMEIKKCIV